MHSGRALAGLALAALVESCMSPTASTASPIRLQVSCAATPSTLLLRDVPLGSVVRPPGANYAVAHDLQGIFAISMIPRDGACALDCGDDDTFVDPCHMGRWSADGTLLDTASDATEDLPHLAVHMDGVCDQSPIRVDAAPNAIEVDPTDRVWVAH